MAENTEHQTANRRCRIWKVHSLVTNSDWFYPWDQEQAAMDHALREGVSVEVAYEITTRLVCPDGSSSPLPEGQL